MTDRIRYNNFSMYPGMGGASGDQGSGERQEQLEDLQLSIPDCTSHDPQKRDWLLPVLLPQHSATASVPMVTMELNVPLDYPQTDATLCVSPVIPHYWVNQSTGVFNPGESTSHNTLKQLMLDGYEALSGTQYVPQSAALSSRPSHSSQPARSPHSLPVTAGQLQGKVQSKLQTLDNEELFKLLTDSQAFNKELQSWLQDTEAGKKYIRSNQELLRAAQSNKDLVAEYEGTEQQVRVTQSGEVQPSMREHDELLATQATLSSKVDVEALVATMVAEASRMDNGEADRTEILSRGAGEPWELHVLSAKLDGYKQKRQAFHEADIKSKAALELTKNLR